MKDLKKPQQLKNIYPILCSTTTLGFVLQTNICRILNSNNLAFYSPQSILTLKDHKNQILPPKNHFLSKFRLLQ